MVNKVYSSFLINTFYEFVYEVIKFKEKILFNKNVLNAQEIQDVLINMIRHKSDTALESGSLIETGFHDMSYIMCVFADEIFINLDWPHQESWKNHNLETQVFHTHIGGRKLFEKISTFLEANSTYKYDLGSAYLICLGMGFRGKYRGIDDNGHIDNLKKRLFALINHKNPSLEFGAFELSPDALKHNVVKVSQRQMSSYKVWLMVLTLISTIYVSLSYIVWHQSLKPVLSLIETSQKDIENAKNG